MIYTLGIYLYAFVVRLLALFGHRKARLMVEGQRATWRILTTKVRPDARYVWVHAASLGEFEQGRPLIERLRREQPDRPILLTFFSPSGYEVRKDYEGADIVCYLPFDTPRAARRFIHLAQPEQLLLIKYEFWGNYLATLHRSGIPVYSVSSIFRPGQRFFRPFVRSGVWTLRCITHFFVQDSASAQLLSTIGLGSRATVVGDTRFDRVADIRQAARALPLVERFAQGRSVLVAGSTWPPDEDLLIDYFNRHPEWQLVLAPHVVDDRHLRDIEAKLHRPALRYSQATPEAVRQADCLIIDNYGLLSSIYRYGLVAYVGGGFGVGIHNVPEAAVYGIPVIIGPNHRKFREAQALLAAGGCREVQNAADFAALMDDFTAHPAHRLAAGAAAGHYISDNAGAADKIFMHIFGK